MELLGVARTVRRHWMVAIVGLVLAVGLAYVTYTNRAPSPFTSTTTLLVTQPGLLYGTTSEANPTGLYPYAYLYAQIAQGDKIRTAIKAPPGSITTAVATTGAFGSGNPLPFLFLTAKAPTSAGARSLAAAATQALREYVTSGQELSHVPKGSRVLLDVVTAAPAGEQVGARRRVVILPGVVFLTVILVALGVMFGLENVSQAPEEARSGSKPTQHRRWLPGAETDGLETLEPTAIRGGFRRRT
jgi:hypothetical protein